MDICITARSGSLSEDSFRLIHQKVEKLAKFYDRVTGVEVMINLPLKGESGVEMKVRAANKGDFFARGQGQNVLSAVESVVQKLEQQLRRYKERMMTRARVRSTPAA